MAKKQNISKYEIFMYNNKVQFFAGKQRDFFTRTWGEDFTENQVIPPSPYVCQLSVKHCEKYLKKLRYHPYMT